MGQQTTPKNITTHHDGHGLAESIHVFATDEVGPGGAHHLYQFTVDGVPDGPDETVGFLQFQKGPRNDPNSTPGVLTVAVLAALIDIQDDFDAGPYPSEFGRLAGYHMREALLALRRRADERASRGVLGKNAS